MPACRVRPEAEAGSGSSEMSGSSAAMGCCLRRCLCRLCCISAYSNTPTLEAWHLWQGSQESHNCLPLTRTPLEEQHNSSMAGIKNVQTSLGKKMVTLCATGMSISGLWGSNLRDADTEVIPLQI